MFFLARHAHWTNIKTTVSASGGTFENQAFKFFFEDFQPQKQANEFVHSIATTQKRKNFFRSFPDTTYP
jgi:hypothetical protein